jgi:hypothetical protein
VEEDGQKIKKKAQPKTAAKQEPKKRRVAQTVRSSTRPNKVVPKKRSKRILFFDGWMKEAKEDQPLKYQAK